MKKIVTQFEYELLEEAFNDAAWSNHYESSFKRWAEENEVLVDDKSELYSKGQMYSLLYKYAHARAAGETPENLLAWFEDQIRQL